MSDAATRARTLRALHVPGDPLVLLNVWDVGSARLIAAQPGVRAIATASYAIAAAHGYADGEQLPWELAAANLGRIAAAVELPVTGDLERGNGAAPADVHRTAAEAIGLGIVGCNFEDSLAGGGLRDVGEQVDRQRAVRAAGDEAGVPFVINARTDALGEGSTLDEAIVRGRAYLDAGADSIFVLGLSSIEDVRRAVGELGTVSVLTGPGRPSIDELAAAGVARISFGPGLMRLSYAAITDAAQQLLGRGDYPDGLAFTIG